MQRALESRAFISAILAMAAGAFLFYTHPFPDEQIFLRVIALRAPHAFLSFKYLYDVLLFTTPYLVCSAALSGLYIFTLKARRTISPGRLPNYPDPEKERRALSCRRGSPQPAQAGARRSSLLAHDSRARFVHGNRHLRRRWQREKLRAACIPFAEQILAYKAADKEKRIGGLILEVKGDFCHKVKDILARHGSAPKITSKSVSIPSTATTLFTTISTPTLSPTTSPRF